MRRIVLALVVAACGDNLTPAADALRADHPSFETCPGLPAGSTFCVPVGANCRPRPSPLCDDGKLALCIDAVCRRECYQLGPQHNTRCETGEREVFGVLDDGSDFCVCVPL